MTPNDSPAAGSLFTEDDLLARADDAAPDEELESSENAALSGDLAQAVSELPRSLEPERSLWPEIRAGLVERAPVVPLRRESRKPRRAAFWPQALAAMLGMAVGAALTWAVLTGPAMNDVPGGDSDGPSEAPGYALASLGEESPNRAEMPFLRAKEELWLAAYARRDDLSPEAWDVVQRNLEILDGAIEDLRGALSQDPGNPDLEERLVESHRRSLDLLRTLADEV